MRLLSPGFERQISRVKPEKQWLEPKLVMPQLEKARKAKYMNDRVFQCCFLYLLAVAAKAPRKQVGGGGVPSVSSPSSGRVRKAKVGSFGNPIKSWPTPAWQKGKGF